MDIQNHYDEVRSIIEACHCRACDEFNCDFDERVQEVMERLLEYDREVDDETIFVCGGTLP